MVCCQGVAAPKWRPPLSLWCYRAAMNTRGNVSLLRMWRRSFLLMAPLFGFVASIEVGQAIGQHLGWH